MLECVEEINESKRFKAYFSDGKTARFGQTNPNWAHTSTIKTKN